MAKLLITTTSIVDGVVDDEKPIPDVVDAEFDKETYEEKFVADVVVVLESKTGELEDVKETKFGEGTKLRKGEGQFLEKDGSLVAMDANKNELRVVEVIKGVVDGKLGELETTVGKMTTEDVMAATTMVSNIELEATKMVQGGESDEVEFAKNCWKSGCLALVEASNMKEEAIVALETTKVQVEAVGMEVSELVEGDLEPREQDAIDWQLESLEDKHDDMVVAVSQVESIKVSMAKDDNDVVVKGQDDVFAAHMMKPRIEQPHLETPKVLEDEVAILLCGVDEKHGGIDPAKVMIAIGGEFATNSQSLVQGEIVIKNAPQVQTMDTNLGEVGEVRATLEDMDTNLGEVGEVRATLEENDNGPKTAVCTKLDRFGEIDATLSELCIAAATIVRGEFNEDGAEMRVAESYRKDTCLDSSDVLVEADIVLDQGEKNYDVMEIKYDEVVLAEEGEMLNVSRPTLESEFVEDDTTSVSIDVTKFELEATFGKDEGIGATLEQEHSQVVTLVVMDLAQDGLIAVKDKPIKESTTLATPDILEKEVKLTTSEEIKIGVPHGPMDSEVTLSAEQPSVKDWKTIVVGDFFDEDVSLLSLHESKSKVEASLGEVDKTDATFEAKDTQTLTEAYGEAIQDVMVARMVEQSMEHPSVVVQHVPKDKASITLGREDEKDDNIGLKFLEVVDITGGELVVDSRATIEDELVIEDAPLVSLHSLDIDLDPTIEEDEEIRPTLVEKDSETTNTIDPKLYEVDWLDATLVQCAASARVEGKFGQDANEVVLGNLLASPDATDVELVIAPDNVKWIGATMQQEDSQGVIPDVTMEDESMLPTRMGLVNDWHMAQEGNMFIECTSLVSLSAPQYEVDAILDEVDGMNAKSKDTSTLPEADQEVTQDVLATHVMATTSSEVDTAFGEFDEIDATFETKDSQTLTHVAVEDTQDVLVTCAWAPSMGSPYLVTHDILEVEVPMMLGEEEEKDTSKEPNIDGVVVEDGGKSAMELHVSTKGELVVEDDAPFLPVHAQEIHLDASLDEVEETTATLEAKESDQSMDVVNTKLDQPQEVDATLVELRGTTTTTVEGEFTQDVSVTLLPEASKKDTCFESPDMLEEAELVLVQEDKKYDTIEAMFEDVVPTVEGELQKDLQGKLDDEFVIEDAPLVSIHSTEIDLDPTLEEEEEIRASHDENSEVTIAIHTKLDELDMIDATLVECAATTRVEADFAQDGLEKTVAESSWKDEFVDYSNVMVEMVTTQCQKDENYDAMKCKFEKALLVEEGKLVKDSVEVFDSEFVMDNLLVSLDATDVELVIPPDDVREIGATMEQEDSQVVKPHDGITIAEVASIEGSTSSSTQNVLQSEDKLALCEGVKKHAPDVTMEDESMLPTRMEFVKDWHMAQEGDMFIECTSLVSLSAPQCEVDAILGEVDGMSAKSKDTSTLPEAGQEVTQDVLAAHVMATTSSEVDTAFGEFDEIDATFETKDSQTLTHVAVEDTQEVSVTSTRAPSMGSPYLVTRDVLEVEVPMMLDGEEEKDTSMEPNIDGVVVEDGGESAMEFHVSTKGEFVVEDGAPFLPVHAQEIHLDASQDEVEETTATLEAKESDQSMDVVNTKLDQPQEVDATLVELHGTTTTTVEWEFTQDVPVTVLPEASKKDTCFESPDMLEEAELMLVQEDKKYDTIEAVFEDEVPTVEGELQKDLQGKLDDEFVIEDAPLVSIHSAAIDLDPTLEEEEEIQASLVENSEVTTAIDTKLDELDMIDATLVECAATTRVKADFAQDGLEKTVAESSWKDEFVDYSNVMVEMETTSCQKDDNYDAMKSKFEKALLAKEGKLVKDSVEVFDSEFVMDNLLASPDATGIELVIPPDDVGEIGATMEQVDSQVVKPQGGITIAEVASIEGSTSSSTQNVLQSEDNLALCEDIEKHAPDVTMEDESMLPTRMEFVKDWHLAQEGDMFIECTSLVSLSAPQCEVDAILGEFDGMSAMAKDTSTLPEADQEVTQDVLAAPVMATTSSEVDTAFGEFDEIDATFETKDSQTLTHVAAEDAQDVSVTCARAPSMGSPYLVTHDVLEVEVPMMLSEEEEKDTSIEPNIDGVVVEDGGKSAMELHVSTKGEFVVEDDAPFLPVHAQEIHLDASLDEVEEATATLEAKESDQSMDVVNTKLDQLQEVDATLVELRGTTTTTVEREFTQDVSVTVLPEASKKDTCFESPDMLEEAELVLVQEDKKYDTIEAMFEDVVPTVEGELQKDLLGKLDDEFVIEDAPLVSIHSAEIDLDPTLEEEEEIRASLVENSEVTIAVDTKLDELDMIDATLVECAATTRVEADFAQDGLEKTVAESSWKEEFVDYSNVMVEMDTTSCQKDENNDAMKSKFEKALLVEEGKLVHDSVEVFDSEFVMDNLLASPDATGVELANPPDDVREIGATMEQVDSQVVKPQGGITIAEVASIEGSTSSSTQNVLQSEDKLALCEGIEKHAPDVTMEDESMLPTRMGFVKDWHMAQEGDMFIECTSLVFLSAPQCEVDAILGEVDGMSAKAKVTSTLPEADQEVTQDVLAAPVMATTSSEVDTAFGEFDEIDATFETKDSQTLTHVAAEDTQDVSVTCAKAPSMGSPYLVARDVLEVEVPMMLGEEEEKDTSMEPNIDGVVVEDGGKSAMELHVSTKGEFVVEDDAPFLPIHAQEIHLDASLDEVEETTATLEAKESDQSMDVVNTKLDHPQEVDATLVELHRTTTTTVEGEFTQDVSVTVLPEASKKDTCFESPDMLEEAELVLVQEDKKYDTIEAMFEDVVPTVEGELQKDLQGKLDDEFVIEDAPLVSIHSPEIDLDPTLEEEEEILASLVENCEVTTAIDTKLYEVDRIDATLVECAATTRVEGEFAQDGLEMTVAESSRKDEYMDSSDIVVQAEIISGQKDENFNVMKTKYEKTLLVEEGKMVKDSVVAVESEFVVDNLLASLDTVKEKPMSFDVIMDGNTGCDDIVVISYNDEICDGCGKTAEEDGRVSSDESPAQVAILDSCDSSIQIIKDTKDDDNNDDWDEEGLGSVALASHLKQRTCTSLGGNITVTSQDTSIFSADLPAGLGSSALSLRPTTTLPSSRSSISSPSELETTPNPIEAMTEDEKKLHEKLELIRVKFLHLVCRMGATPEESVAAQVLYHLNLAKGIHRGQASSLETLESAWNKVLQQEAESREDLSFSCNILVLGKTGVGKSATINSIFGEEKSKTDAFDASTTNVREISSNVDGVQVHIIDTPGLRTDVTNQGWNKKILSAIKSYTKKCPPDMILYVDRLDSWSRDDDLPLLRTITATFGTSIWLNVIVTLTHAASAPPDSSNGDPVTYETLIAQRSHIIQQSVRQAASDMRLMNPVALVENHPYCRRNRQGQMVLPNGQAWRNQLLLLCYSTKILSEANSLLKLQDPSPREYSCFGFRSLPLPFLLSSLLQPRSHPKLSADHGGDEDDSDVDLDDYSDICDDEDEYDRLPTFRPLTKAQFHKLTKDQKNEYLDEYDYWVKLLQKKQWKGGLQQLKEMKKRGKAEQDSYGYGNMAGENDRDVPLENIAVPLPDMVLPPSFDSDDPTYRYRFLESTSTIVSRPVLDVHSWDHDCGFDGVSLEDSLAIAREFPAAVSVQLTKDKKELTIHLDSSISGKHGENASSLAGFDVLSVRQQLAYGLWGETKFKNIKKNKTTGGFSVTFLGDTMATGVKVEDQLSVGKSLSLVASTGAMRAQGDTAYGANLEARLKDKDYPINQFMLFLGLSLMKWRGDLAFGANMQSQFSVGRGSKMALHIGLNNKLSGQINVKMSTSEQVQMALLGLVPFATSIYKSFRPAEA